MTTKVMSKNGTRPGYEIGGHWVWVEYPAHEIVGEDFGSDEDFAGFAIQVLKNPNGSDDRMLAQALRDYIHRLQALTQSDPDNQDLVDAAEDDYLRIVAPRVRAWNAVQDGKPVPAPGEVDDPEAFRAFYVIPLHLKQWTTAVVREITIPKRMTRRSSNAGPTAISTPTSRPPEQERPSS